jgi:hypothetical protein
MHKCPPQSEGSRNHTPTQDRHGDLPHILNPDERLNCILSRIFEEFQKAGQARELPTIYETALARTEITQDVEIVYLCFKWGLYEYCRKANQKVQKIVRREQKRAALLAFYNLPPSLRQVIFGPEVRS